MSPSNSQRELYERILNSTSEQELNNIKTMDNGYIKCGWTGPGSSGIVDIYYGSIPVNTGYYGSIRIF